MRIAIAVTQGEHGGVQDFLARFMAWLKSQGHEVAIFCGPGAWLEQKCREQGIRFTRLNKLKREISFSDIGAIFELKYLLEEFKPDAIHLNSSKIGIIGSIAGRLAHTPRIAYRIGGWVFLEDLPAWKKSLYRSFERYTASFKDVIVCVHPDDVEAAKAAGIKPKKEILCVPNGINIQKFRAELLSREDARRSLGLDDGIIFGTIANFYPAKDLPRYIEACALVSQKFPDARFVIVGDGEQRHLIEAAIKQHQLENKVLLAGAREDADRLYLAFDAFVLPSSKEGMSWALLRAMASGLKCIATDVGAATWMLGSEGIVVPSKNPAALAEAMGRISSIQSSDIGSRFDEQSTFAGNLKALAD